MRDGQAESKSEENLGRGTSMSPAAEVLHALIQKVRSQSVPVLTHVMEIVGNKTVIVSPS